MVRPLSDGFELDDDPGRIDRAALVEGYGAMPSVHRLWLMRAALHLVAGSWTYAEIAGGNTAPGLDALLERSLSGLEAMLNDPALAAHLAASD